MGFLFPWFLAGIAAIGLPIWLHLRRRHRSTPQPFSSLMFFECRTQSLVKRRKLQYLLLFFLRITLLILLALAFAQPYILSTVLKANPEKLMVIAIDRSFSMKTTTADRHSRLEQAKAQARDFVSSIPSGSRAQVITLDAQVQHLASATADHSELISSIDSITPSDERSSFGELSRAIRAFAETSKMPLEVHLFSDLQQSSAPSSFSDLDPGQQATVHLHPIEAQPIANWAVASVEAPAYVWKSKPVLIRATLASWNAQETLQKEASVKRVTLVVDGRTVESKQVTMQGSERPRIEFHFEPGHGRHQAEIRLEPHDSLSQDDRLLFSIERADPGRILFLHRGNTTAAMYYRTAIESAQNPRFVVDTVSLDSAAGILPSNYSVIILADTGRLRDDLETALRSYVNNGGGLLIMAGRESAATGRIPVTEARISQSDAGKDEQAVTKIDKQHPALLHTSGLTGVLFSDLARVDISHARILASTASGTPVLLEQAYGGGRILILTSSLERESTNLPLNPAFVPFVQDSALYLAGGDIATSHLPVGAISELRQSPQQKGSVGVLGPEGKQLVPLDRATSEQSFRFEREGFYEIHKASGRRQLTAVNADREESNLTPIAPEIITLWQKAGAANAVAAAGASTPTAQRHSFWRWIILTVLLIAVVESIFGSRYLTTSREAS